MSSREEKKALREKSLVLRSQCTYFTKTGGRCIIPAVEGQDTCPRHGKFSDLQHSPEVLLNTHSSLRDVARRVRAKIKEIWPDLLFEITEGYSITGEKIGVIIWTNGPTVEEVNLALVELYAPMALGWGMSYGVPQIECSRDYSPEVLVAALFHVMVDKGIVEAPKKVTRTWMRAIFVPALDFLHGVADPEQQIDGRLLAAADKLLLKFPPEEKLFDMTWITQICFLAVPAVKKMVV